MVGPFTGFGRIKWCLFFIWYSTALITVWEYRFNIYQKLCDEKQTTPLLLLPRIHVLSTFCETVVGHQPLIPFMWVVSYFSLAPNGWLWRVYFTKAFLHPIHPTLHQLYSGTSRQSLSFTPVLFKPRFFLSVGNYVNHLSGFGLNAQRASIIINI